MGLAGHGVGGWAPTRGRCGGSGVRLEVPGGGWTGRRFQLGKNKEVFGAVFAIWQALRALEQRKESGRRYTVFIDSTSAITRVQDDAVGEYQTFSGYSHTQAAKAAACRPSLEGRRDRKVEQYREEEKSILELKEKAT